MAEDRIRYISHKGKAVLLVDVSHSSAAEFERICKLVPEFVTREPRQSVLILGDFTGAKFDKNAIEALKRGAVFDRPHVRRSAWVGVDSFPRVFFDNIKSFTQRELPTFKTREEALEWLVKQ